MSGPRSISRSVTLPGDKSMAHRALLFAALARTPSRIANVPASDDVAHTVACLRALGTHVELDGSIAHVEPRAWSDPAAPLDCGNAGTLARLLMGALAGEAVDATLVGDASLSSRPMRRVADPLRALFGLDVVELAEGATLPARVHGSIAFAAAGVRRAQSPENATFAVETHVASAQVKSALVLAARAFSGDVDVVEPVPTRDHTERMLAAFGAPIVTRSGARGARIVSIGSPFEWSGFDVALPGDPSSAALLAVYAVVARKRVRFVDVLANPFRIAFVDALKHAGVDVALASSTHATRAGEPIADVNIAGAPLARGFDVGAHLVPALVDEIPALAAIAIASPCASVFRGVGELRVKESDRAALLVALAHAFGAHADIVDDTLTIRGVDRVRAPSTRVRTDGDHRIAMAALSLAKAIDAPVELDAPGCERTSFPEFRAVLDAIAVDDDDEAH